MFRPFIGLLSLFLVSPGAFAAGATVTYQGRILQPDGNALNTGNIQFRIQVRTPDTSNCLMYEETRTVPMTGSNGIFALSLNGSGASRTDTAAVYDFNRIFANKGTFTFPVGDCGVTNTYTPTGSASRKIVAMFYANGAWEALPSMNVNFVPFAIESTTVGGYGSGDLLRVDHLASETVTPFTFTDYGKLVDLIGGKLNGSVLPTLGSGQVLGSDGAGGWAAVTPLTAAGLPACATGEYLRVSSGALVCQAVAMSGGTVTSITAGPGLTGGTITSSGTIALATVGSGGTGSKITYDAYGRVTASSALVETDIPTLSASGKVSGSAISGTIGNGTAISTSGAIQTSTDLMAGRFYMYDGGGTNTVGLRAPATVTPYVLTYPAAQGANGQTLVNNGAGVLSWTSPLASVSGAASLSNGKIWVGDGSSKAQEVSVSGDGILSSTGALTLITVPIAKGGTGLTTAATNGQLLIGNGSGYTLGTLTAGSGISVLNAAGGITLSATGSGGTVTNVTGTAPIAVATGTSTPIVSITKATSSVDGYLAATDFSAFAAKLGTSSVFAGDVSGTSAAMSVDRIKGSALTITTPSSGQYLKYNGTNWINAVIDAADIGTGTLLAARMPAHTGDVTSSAGSTALTLATVVPAKGGTGLTSIGTANQILGVNTGATGLEYKSLTAGTGVTITPAAGSLTINATGSGGTVTNVTSSNIDIAVASSSTTPTLTLNSGTSASQILKLNASAQIPAVDGSLLTNLNPANLSAVLPVGKGGTGAATLPARGVLIGQGTSAVTSIVGLSGSILQSNGAGADPTFTASPVFGINGTTTGTLVLANGAASGASTVLSPSASTTASYTFTLPVSGGTNGYLLQTNGAGVTSWVAPAGSGTVNSGTANQLTYYSGTGTAVSGLTSANNSVLVTNGSGVPAWTSLTIDNFIQYALLAGRNGGQALKGGVAASENLTLDSTANATKGYVTIAPSGGNVGIGTTTPSSVLQVGGAIAVPITTKASAYTLLANDSVVMANATSAAVTITLPSAVGINGRQYTIKKTDSSANNVTIATSSSQTIDGSSTLALSSQYQFVTLISDGTAWAVIGQSSGAASASNSVAFGFTDVTSATPTTLYTTSTVTTTGSGSTTLYVSGPGSPQLSVGGAPWATSSIIAAGQTLALRQTSAAAGNTTNTASVVGGAATTNWSVTTAMCSPTTQTYGYTGGAVTLPIPSGCNTVTVKVWGGGGAASDQATGGTGGFVTSNYSAFGGKTLTIKVGGAGVTANAGVGGYNGGANGGASIPGRTTGGGGGASTVVDGSTMLLAAAGGGGGSYGGAGGSASSSFTTNQATYVLNGTAGGSGHGSGAGGCNGGGGGGGGGGIGGTTQYCNDGTTTNPPYTTTSGTNFLYGGSGTSSGLNTTDPAYNGTAGQVGNAGLVVISYSL